MTYTVPLLNPMITWAVPCASILPQTQTTARQLDRRMTRFIIKDEKLLMENLTRVLNDVGVELLQIKGEHRLVRRLAQTCKVQCSEALLTAPIGQSLLAVADDSID